MAQCIPAPPTGQIASLVDQPPPGLWYGGWGWGEATGTLKLEARFDASAARELAARGHEVEILQAFDEAMGHAGCLVRHADGVLEGGADPRSDGVAAGF